MLRMELVQKLILVCELCYIATKGEASLTRMMTDGCNHHGLSLYLEVCCAISNLGQAMTIKGKGTLAYIFCPAIIPKDCPGNLNIQMGSVLHYLYRKLYEVVASRLQQQWYLHYQP